MSWILSIRSIGIILHFTFHTAVYSCKRDFGLKCECGSVLDETNPMVVFLNNKQLFCNGVRISKNHVLTSRSCYTQNKVTGPPGNVVTMATKPFDVYDYNWVRKAEFDLLVLETRKALNSTEPKSGIPCIFKERENPKFPELSSEDYLYTYAFQKFNDQSRTKRRVFLEEMESCPNWEFSNENIICTKDNSSMVDDKVVSNIDWCTIDTEIHPGTGLYLRRKDVSYLIGIATNGFPRNCLSSNDLIMQFVSLKGLGDHIAQVVGDCKSCPICKFNPHYDLLHCEAGTLKAGSEIPLSISEECWTILAPYNVIYKLVIEDQPHINRMDMSELHRFFPDLKYLTVRDTNLTSIGIWKEPKEDWKLAGQVFFWLREINLDSNLISTIEGGTLEGIFSLKRLSMTNNTSSPSIETKSWPFCYRLEKGELEIQPSIEVIKNFDYKTPTKVEEEYCGYENQSISVEFNQHCIVSEYNPDQPPTMDCSGANMSINWYLLPCLRRVLIPISSYKPSIEKIKIPFVKTSWRGDIQDEFDCEVGRDVLKSLTKDPQSNGLKSELVLYGINIDLKILEIHTEAAYTQNVVIYADKVFLSAPLSITYNLDIKARIVHLEHPIILIQDFSSFMGSRLHHFKTEKILVYNEATRLSYQKFGEAPTIQIVEAPLEKKINRATCVPKAEHQSHSDHWYGLNDLFLKLASVCLKSQAKSNPSMTRKIAEEYVLLSNNEANSWRFQKLVGQTDDIAERIHPVPTFSLPTLEKFVSEMKERLGAIGKQEEMKKDKIFHLSRDAVTSKRRIELLHHQLDKNYKLFRVQMNLFHDTSKLNWKKLRQLSEANHEMYNNTSMEIFTYLSGASNITNQIQINKVKLLIKTSKAQVDTEKEHLDDQHLTLRTNIDSQYYWYHKLNTSYTELDKAIESAEFDLRNESIVKGVVTVLGFFSWLAGAVVSAIASGPGAVPVSDSFIPFKFVTMILDVIHPAIRASKAMKELKRTNFTLSNYTGNLKEALTEASKLKKVKLQFGDLRGEADYIYQELSKTAIVTNPINIKRKLYTVADVGETYVSQVAAFSKELLKFRAKERNYQFALKQQRFVENTWSLQELNQTLITMKTDHKKSFDKLSKASKTLKRQVEEISQSFETESEELRKQHIEALNASLTSMQREFDSYERKQDSYYQKLIGQLGRQILLEQEGNLDQRLLLQNLLDDICDALFYMYFDADCSDLDMKIEDSYDKMVENLSNIKWEIIRKNEENAGNMHNSDEKVMFVRDPSIISALRENKTVLVNLKEHLEDQSYQYQIHFRVYGMKIYFLDENDNTLFSRGTDFSSGALVQIGLPALFKDYDPKGNIHTFYGRARTCKSSYTWVPNMLEVGKQRHPMFSDWCKMQDSHRYRNKRVTLNGYYNLTMLKPPLEFEKLTHLKIILGAAKGGKRKRTKKNLEPI